MKQKTIKKNDVDSKTSCDDVKTDLFGSNSLFDIAMFLYSSLNVEKRPGQTKMIENMCDTIERSILRQGCIDDKTGISLGQVPTGTGKSMAIILTALSAWLKYGMKTVVSTHTHVLQDQMLYKDFPFIKNNLTDVLDGCILNKWKGTIVKGVENHVCRKKTELLKTMADSVRGKTLLVNSSIQKNYSFLGQNSSKITVVMGSHLAEIISSINKGLSSLSEDDPLFGLVRGDLATCFNDCQYMNRCPYIVSTRAKVPFVVTNHAYLLPSLRFSEPLEDFNKNREDDNEDTQKQASISPFRAADLYFFDEAHHLAGYRTGGRVLTSVDVRKINRLLDFAIPGNQVELFEQERERRKTFINEALRILNSETEELSTLKNILEVWRKSLESIRVAPVKNCLFKTFDQATEILSDISCFKKEEQKKQTDGVRKIISSDTVSIIADENSCMSEDIKASFPNVKSVFAISGTLFNNNEEARSFIAETGLEPTSTPFIVDSPFKQNKVIVWVPKPAPIGRPFSGSKRDKEREQNDFSTSFCRTYIPSYLKADMGGVLVLCSAKHRMNIMAEAVKREMERLYGMPWLVMKQGEKSRRQTAKEFVKSPVSRVLFASASFREGFDARGKQLTWVIIDRLPFPVPGSEDALQIKKLKEAKLIDDEFSHMLSLMKIRLSQSAGRLIRTEQDWGGITLLDNRVLYSGKNWGCETCFPVPVKNWYTDLPLNPEKWVEMMYSLSSSCSSEETIYSGDIDRINNLVV